MVAVPARGRPPAGYPRCVQLLNRLYARFRDLVHELGKFGVVGAVAYLVDSVLLLVLDARGWEPLWAKTVATVAAATVAFVGNRFWTWRHRARTGFAREYGLFFLFNVIGLGIALACLAVTYHGLGALWPSVFRTTLAVLISANVVGLAAGTVFRFWSYRRFVFRPAPQPGLVSTEVVVTGQTPAGRPVPGPAPAAGGGN